MRKKNKNRHTRVWIVQAHFICGTWDVCDFVTGYSYVHTDYFKAHVLKERICNYLIEDSLPYHRGQHRKGKHVWTRGDFRVREYKIVKEDKSPHLDPESRFFHKRLIRLEKED